MIVLKVQGGLGNQLFQYSAGRALSLALNAELVLDLSWFENQMGINTKREYELNAYKIIGRVAQGGEKFWCQIHQNRFTSRIKFLHRKWIHIKDINQGFDKEYFKRKGAVYLDGYWQSYRYFDGYSNVIRKDLVLNTVPSPIDSNLIKKMDGVNSVSMHIRRGDYVTNPRAASFHGLCSMEYYQKAMRSIAEKVTSPHYFIFSDEIDWVRKNMHFESDVTFVQSDEDRSPVEDLRLMSICKHNIIANSSFSWWGAWLNTNPDKLVIAPDKWFVNGTPNSLIPVGWMSL